MTVSDSSMHLSHGSVSIDVPHGDPDILHLSGLVQELLPGPLLGVLPVARQPVVHPRPFHVLRGHILDVLGAFLASKVPQGLNNLNKVGG